jgi:hypothetical protein
MTGRRVIRGFRRLGIVLAAPFFLGGMMFLGTYGYSLVHAPNLVGPIQRSQVNAPQTIEPSSESKEILKQYGVEWPHNSEGKSTETPPIEPGSVLELFGFGPDGKPLAGVESAPTNISEKSYRNSDLFWVSSLFGVGASLFIVSLAIGWVVAGFAKE